MERPREPREEGFVIVVLLTLLVPMLLVVGAFSVAMTGRTNELVVEMDEERALMAAEAGVDYCIFQAQQLTPLNGVTYQRTLSNDLSFEAVATYLKSDSLDNDNDGLTDEADEDVYQVVVTGTSRATERRVAAYLGAMPALTVDPTAMAIQNPGVELDLRGTSEISGDEVDIDGNPTGASLPGMSIAPPGTIADLEAQLTGSEPNMVTGLGSNPSLAEATTVADLSVLVPQLQNAANIVLTAASYQAYKFGDGPAGEAYITYREGNVKFGGNSQGAGVLVVTGNLELTGNFVFHGVVIVLGSLINSSGTADIYGSVIQGPSGALVEARGTMKVTYSSEAVDLVDETAKAYVAFNGWQELSR